MDSPVRNLGIQFDVTSLSEAGRGRRGVEPLITETVGTQLAAGRGPCGVPIAPVVATGQCKGGDRTV